MTKWESLQKSPKYGILRASASVNTSMCQDSDIPNSMGTEGPMLGTLLDLALYASVSTYSSVSFFILNKAVIVSECFPEFCGLFKQTGKPKEVLLWPSDLYRVNQKYRWLCGIHDCLRRAGEVRTVLWDWALNLGSALTAVSIKANESMDPDWCHKELLGCRREKNQHNRHQKWSEGTSPEVQ